MEIIRLNLIPKGASPTCYASQYDNERTVRVKLFDGLTPYVFNEGDTLGLIVKRTDGESFTQDLTVEAGLDYSDFYITEDMSFLTGVNECELRLANGAKNIGTLNFFMSIEEAVGRYSPLPPPTPPTPPSTNFKISGANYTMEVVKL